MSRASADPVVLESARPPDAADEAAVARCLCGDAGGYKALYDRYGQPLLRTALRMLGRREDAEDAVQETFLRLHRGLPGYRSGSRFSTYLFRILLNASFDILRKRGRAKLEEIDDDRLPAGSSPEEMHSLGEAIAALPPRMKAAFLLSAVEEFSQDEVGAMLGVGAHIVKADVHRARVRLRAWLSAAGPGSEP